MSLVLNDKYYIPYNKSQITDLPLEYMKPYEISLYSVEKCYLINGKLVKIDEMYPIIEFKSNDKEKIEMLNYSKNYIPFKKGYIKLNDEFYSFTRNKINILILIFDNEIKINDMNKLLFYIINNCPDKKKSISITVILCTLNFSECRPFFLLHDKPYHFYDDYVSNNKEAYEKFLKKINTIYKMYTINLAETNKFDVFEIDSLNIYPSTLPQFIIYDKNYRIIYKDNMFQETPQSLEEICKILYEKIENPSCDKKFKYLSKSLPIKVKSFFYKIEKNINNNIVYNNEEEFNEGREKLLNKIREETIKEENINKSCRVYFIKKYQSLTKEQLESINETNIKDLSKSKNIKLIYLKPIITINNDYSLFSPFMETEDVVSHKRFRKNTNLFLSYIWKCLMSFCENNNLKNYEIQLKSSKTFTNLSFNSKKELNVFYKNGLEFYYIPMNFRTLFMDKSKFFDVHLKPYLITNQNYKVKYKDINTKEKTLEIKVDEISFFQLFRENAFQEQNNFGEIINKLRKENPKVPIKYYLVVLTAGDQFKNSVFYDKVKAFLDTFTYVDDILFYSYLIDEFYEMSQYFTLLRNIYIFGLKNESYYFELIPDKIEKSKEMLVYYVNKLLLKSYEKEIDKSQYKLLKQTWKDFLKIQENNKDKILMEIELSKIKFFDNKDTKYIFKCYNHEKKIKDDNQNNNNHQIKELIDLKHKIQEILEHKDSNKNQIII